jgi:hypothetical protein
MSRNIQIRTTKPPIALLHFPGSCGVCVSHSDRESGEFVCRANIAISFKWTVVLRGSAPRFKVILRFWHRSKGRRQRAAPVQTPGRVLMRGTWRNLWSGPVRWRWSTRRGRAAVETDRGVSHSAAAPQPHFAAEFSTTPGPAPAAAAWAKPCSAPLEKRRCGANPAIPAPINRIALRLMDGAGKGTRATPSGPPPAAPRIPWA